MIFEEYQLSFLAFWADLPAQLVNSILTNDDIVNIDSDSGGLAWCQQTRKVREKDIPNNILAKINFFFGNLPKSPLFQMRK